MHVEFAEEADEFLSLSDIKNALNNLTDANVFKLESIAKQYSYYCSMERDEILNEAIVKTLSKERKCPSNIPIIAFIAQTMRSITFNERRKNEKLESINNSIDTLQDGSVSPEDKTSAHLELNRILEMFKNDDDITLYLMGIHDECTPDEICEIGEWDRKKYCSVQKRLRRSLNKHYPNGREK